MDNPVDILTPSVNQPSPRKAVRLTGDLYARRAHARREANRAIAYTEKVVAPALARKAADMSLTDSELRPAERAARQIRQELLAELAASGADVPGARAIVDACVVEILTASTLHDYLMRMLNDGGVINRNTHQTYSIVDTMGRLHARLTSKLKLLQLHKAQPKKAPLSPGEWLKTTPWAVSRQPASTVSSGAGTHGAEPKPKIPKQPKGPGSAGGPRIGRRPAGGKLPPPVPPSVTPAPSIDSSNGVDDQNQNLPGDRNEPAP